MDELLGDSHSTDPSCVYASMSAASSSSSSSYTIGSDRESEEPNSEGTKRKTKPETRVEKKRKSVSGVSQMITFLQDYTKSIDESRNRQERRHEEQMNFLKDMTSAITKLVEKK